MTFVQYNYDKPVRPFGHMQEHPPARTGNTVTTSNAPKSRSTPAWKNSWVLALAVLLIAGIGLGGYAIAGGSSKADFADDDWQHLKAEQEGDPSTDIPDAIRNGPSGVDCVLDLDHRQIYRTGYFSHTPVIGEHCVTEPPINYSLVTGRIFNEYLDGYCVQLLGHSRTVVVIGYC